MTVAERFAMVDAGHPEIWDLFVTFTFERIRQGFNHHSADAVLHRVRWETAVPAMDDGTGFKINNDYSAYYARKFHSEFPEYAGFFRLRASKADAQ